MNVENELNMERVRKFSSRARAYICTYHYLATKPKEICNTPQGAQGEEMEGNKEEDRKPPMMDEIERLMQKFKSHRCAFDFDRGFLMDAS